VIQIFTIIISCLLILGFFRYSQLFFGAESLREPITDSTFRDSLILKISNEIHEVYQQMKNQTGQMKELDQSYKELSLKLEEQIQKKLFEQEEDKPKYEEKPFVVVIPYVKDALPIMFENFRTWGEDGLAPPCKKIPTKYRADIIFYNNGFENTTLKSQILTAIEGKPRARNCFKEIHFKWAELQGEEDKYPKGPNNMFWGMIHHLKDKIYSHMFWMEVDVHVIKENWLDAVHTHLVPPMPSFWMKGTMYVGGDGSDFQPTQTTFRHHINGNAIYNVGDQEFVQFLERASKHIFWAFDTNIWDYLAQESNWSFRRKHVHLFIYSDLIMNYGMTKYSLQTILKEHPNLHFMHQGVNTDPETLFPLTLRHKHVNP